MTFPDCRRTKMNSCFTSSKVSRIKSKPLSSSRKESNWIHLQFKRLKMKKDWRSKIMVTQLTNRPCTSFPTPSSLGEKQLSNENLKNTPSRISNPPSPLHLQGRIKLLTLLRWHVNSSRRGLTTSSPTLPMCSIITKLMAWQQSTKRRKNTVTNSKGWLSRPMQKERKKRERLMRGTGSSTSYCLPSNNHTHLNNSSWKCSQK